MSDRSLATILFTDIVASTEQVTRLGDRAWQGLLAQHHALVRREIRRRAGREVATTGDGVLAIFHQPEAGISCAWAIRELLRSLGLQIRAGVHLGGIEEIEETIGGLAVHIAHRVSSLAGPDEILVSATVHGAVQGAGFEFEPRGKHTLKGTNDSWEIYSVKAIPDLDSTAFRTSRGPRRLVMGASLFVIPAILVLVLFRANRYDTSPSLPSEVRDSAVAIVPFSVNDARQSAWRLGLADLLAANIDGVAGIQAVDSRTLQMRTDELAANSGHPSDVTLARSAGAGYLVRGNAVWGARRVRLHADILRTHDSTPVARIETEGHADSIFVLVDNLAVELVSRVKGIRGETISGFDVSSITTHSLPAFRAFLAADSLYRQSEFAAALPHFRSAFQIDSLFALARFRYALSCIWSACEDSGVIDHLTRAAQMAERLPARESILVRGVLEHVRGSGRAVNLLREASRQYPDDPEILYWLGEEYWHFAGPMLMDYQSADQTLQAVVRLNPRLTSAYAHLIGLAFIHHADVSLAQRLLAQFGSVGGAQYWIDVHNLALQLVRWDTQSRIDETALQEVPTDKLEAVLGYDLRPARNFAATQAVLVALKGRSPIVDRSVNIDLFWLSIAMGRLDSAREQIKADMLPGNHERGLYYLNRLGIELDPLLVKQHLRLTAADEIDSQTPSSTWDESTGARLFYLGAYAIDHHLQNQDMRVRSRFSRMASSALMSGDTIAAGRFSGMAAALDGYRLWKSGEPDEGLTKLLAGQRSARGFLDDPNRDIRWWIGDLLVELGRLDDAEPFFRSISGSMPGQPSFGSGEFQDGFAKLRLAQIYEKLGNQRRADRVYALLAEDWVEADAEVKALLSAAR